MGKHTILLVQPTRQASTRTFYDYPSVNEAVDCACLGLACLRVGVGGCIRTRTMRCAAALPCQSTHTHVTSGLT